MPLLLTVDEAAGIVGIPVSTLRKMFMERPPAGRPLPPPHVRIGRSIRIPADRLKAWVDEMVRATGGPSTRKGKGGRPTKAEQIAARLLEKPDTP